MTDYSVLVLHVVCNSRNIYPEKIVITWHILCNTKETRYGVFSFTYTSETYYNAFFFIPEARYDGVFWNHVSSRLYNEIIVIISSFSLAEEISASMSPAV